MKKANVALITVGLIDYYFICCIFAIENSRST